MPKRQLGYLAIGAGGLVLIATVVFILGRHLSVHGPGSPAQTRAPTVAILRPTPGTASPSAVLPTPSPTAAASVSPTAPSNRPGVTSRPAPTPSNVGQESVAIMYDQSGQGNAMTRDFQVPSQWLIYWSYACAPPSSSAGALKVTVYLEGMDPPLKSFSNDNGTTSGVEHNYVGDGWYHLAVESWCSWRLTVTPAPGYSVSPTPSG